MNKKLLIAAALLLVVGCKSGKSNTTTPAQSVTDIPPSPIATSPIDTTPVSISRAPEKTPSYTTPVSIGSKYVVQKGDTLWSIASKKYGDGKQFKKIKDANNLKSDNIMVGQALTLP